MFCRLLREAQEAEEQNEGRVPFSLTRAMQESMLRLRVLRAQTHGQVWRFLRRLGGWFDDR